MRVHDKLNEDEGIHRVFGQTCFEDTLEKIKHLLDCGYEEDRVVNVWSKRYYGEIKAFIDEEELTWKMKVETKYNAMVNKNQTDSVPNTIELWGETWKNFNSTKFKGSKEDMRRVYGFKIRLIKKWRWWTFNECWEGIF